MKNNALLEKVSRLGLPLMEADDNFDVNQTLSEVVKSREMRLWEGFPVLLMNAAKENNFNYDRVLNNLSDGDKKTFRDLLLLSLTLYDNYHLSFSWSKQLMHKFSNNDKVKLKQWRTALSHNESFSFAKTQFHPDRLKKVFELYVEKDAENTKQKSLKYEKLSLEYSLSQMFSPKQKELFKKKLDGLLLTKTEKEYFSRTVKKKVAALANVELHHMAQKLMQF